MNTLSLLTQCRSTLTEGHEYFSQSSFEKACFHFKQASMMAETLCLQSLKKEAIKLWLMANHNAASSYNRSGLCAQATQVLERCHQFLLSVSGDEAIDSDLRIEALGYLQQSLFSLVSQYGYLGQNLQVYQHILDTDEHVKRLSTALLMDD